MNLKPEDVSQGSLSAETVAELEGILARHYGEPVRPVSKYCNAFRTWFKALAERKKRVEAMDDNDPYKAQEQSDPLTSLVDNTFGAELAISKSNLLWRLIYQDQPLRTEMCPVHKGQWSGYNMGDEWCPCQNGWDITGWLPNHELSLGEKIQLFLHNQGALPLRLLTHGEPNENGFRHQAVSGEVSVWAATTDEAIEQFARKLEKDGFIA